MLLRLRDFQAILLRIPPRFSYGKALSGFLARIVLVYGVVKRAAWRSVKPLKSVVLYK